MYIEVGSSGTASPTITDNVFTSNDAQFGGALTYSITSGNSATIKAALTNVLFSGNSASLGGGAVSIFAGDNVASPSFTDVDFSGNTAASIGGALYNSASGGTASPTFTNVVFSGNSTAAGGAIYNRTDGNSGNLADPSLTNVTFTNNSASSDGGAIYNDGGSSGSASPVIANVILWNNTADGDGNTMYNSGSTAQPSIRHSIVESGQNSTSENNGSSTTYEVSTNLEQDPQFVDAADPDGSDDTWATTDDGLRLKGAGSPTPSPAIDAGDNSSIPSGITTDLLGADRTYEGDGDGTATVDMGPYEYSGTPLPVELASFEGTQTSNETVRLAWTTVSETNNAGFAVQHRVGKKANEAENAWTTVGFVDGAGTIDQFTTYRFTAENLAPGPHRFRLRQVDLDGTAHPSDPIAVEIGMTQPMRLSAPAPNPVRKRATLSFAVKEARQTTLTIYNVLGQQVDILYRGTPPAGNAQTVALSAADLPSGTYFLRLQAGGQTQTERLTVVR
jgi:predicted outer membrane repeat protein